MMANRMKTSSLIYIVMCALPAMADAGVERDPLPSLDKPGMWDTSDKQGRKPTVMIDDKGVAICNRDQCTYNSFAELNRTFPGLFPTVEEYQRQTGLPVMSTNTCAYVFKERFPGEALRTQAQCRIGPSDGDDCCPTYKSIVPYISLSPLRRRTNIQGQWCYTLQLFTVGTCGGQTNNCGDKCMKETNLMHLYAYNYGTESFGFFIFQIESYCSCKALQNS